MVIPISKVPLWAVLMSLVYLCKRKLTSVVRPTRQWGPGDPQVTLLLVIWFGDDWICVVKTKPTWQWIIGDKWGDWKEKQNRHGMDGQI